MFITIINQCTDPVAAYAARELAALLTRCTNHQVGSFENADRLFVLAPLEGEAYGYSIQGTVQDGKPCVALKGTDGSAVLCAVYEALKAMGWVFQMNGPLLPGGFKIDACDQMTNRPAPLCRYRGIRQHINFPMDISSYHLECAQEYIRNLARMGMNSITFHSYTGQWHGYTGPSGEVLAGNYFYGQRHMVPDYPSVSRGVDNHKFYCIPEIEGQLSDDKARADFSIRWLNCVMETAKEAGMHVTLSIELPDESQETLIGLVQGVVDAYPHMDALEWISPEGGGQGAPLELNRLLEVIEAWFGKEALTDAVRNSLPEQMPDSLPGAMESLKRAIDLYKVRDQIGQGLANKELRIGLYVMCRETLRLLKNVMTAILPAEIVLTFLPAHGSLAVAQNIEYMGFTPAELQRTMLYSWVEFDGNMYLQQNSSKGIEVLMENLSGLCGSVYGVCFNHWRTAENEIVAAFLSEAAVAPVSTGSFYPAYAERMRIGRPAEYGKAMTVLEEVDCFNRDYLFNIGFCYLGCWLNTPGLGWVRGWDLERMDQSIVQYQTAAKLLEGCLEETEAMESIEALRLYLNRIDCSILQINCVRQLRELCAFVEDGHPEKLSAAQKEEVLTHCDNAMALCRAYLDKHMEMAVDRGCQGTAVSYAATIPVYVDHIRQSLVYGEQECTHRPTAFDQPPPPDTAYLY